MSTPEETAPPVLPTFKVEMAFHRIRDGHREDSMTVEARGSQTFVTRMVEAAAGALEEEATR